MKWHDIATRHNMTWHDMISRPVPLFVFHLYPSHLTCSTVRFIRLNMWHDMTWHDIATWHDMTWYRDLFHCLFFIYTQVARPVPLFVLSDVTCDMTWHDIATRHDMTWYRDLFHCLFFIYTRVAWPVPLFVLSDVTCDMTWHDIAIHMNWRSHLLTLWPLFLYVSKASSKSSFAWVLESNKECWVGPILPTPSDHL